MAAREHIICENIKWIDVMDPSVAEMEELSKTFNLNEHTVRDCLQPEHLPKYEVDNDIHFLILRFYAHEFDKRLATIQELTNKIAIFYTEDFLITIHKYATPFVDAIRRKYNEPQANTSTTDVLAKIAWNALETFDAPANRLSEQVDFYENLVISKKADNDLVEALYLIKRQASVSHKVLMLMQEPINHLSPVSNDKAAFQDMRDQHLKMQTLYSQVLDEVNNLLNLTISFAAQRTSDVMRILTLFSVFFMPLTFIAGIYGMNFQFMPELQKKWGYPAALSLMVIITAVIYQWFKRKKWL